MRFHTTSTGRHCTFFVRAGPAGRVDVDISGELDVHSGATLAAIIDGAGSATVGLDLSDVVFIDRGGEEAIRASVGRRDVSIIVVAVSAEVERQRRRSNTRVEGVGAVA